MNIQISFIHMDHTESLDERIQEKSQKLLKLMDTNPKIKWTCYVKDKTHFAEVQLTGKQVDFFAKAGSDSLYKTIDQAIDKIEKQFSKQKGKVKNKIHRKTDIVIRDTEEAWADYDEDYVEDAS